MSPEQKEALIKVGGVLLILSPTLWLGFMFFAAKYEGCVHRQEVTEHRAEICSKICEDSFFSSYDDDKQRANACQRAASFYAQDNPELALSYLKTARELGESVDSRIETLECWVDVPACEKTCQETGEWTVCKALENHYSGEELEAFKERWAEWGCERGSLGSCTQLADYLAQRGEMTRAILLVEKDILLAPEKNKPRYQAVAERYRCWDDEPSCERQCQAGLSSSCDALLQRYSDTEPERAQGYRVSLCQAGEVQACRDIASSTCASDAKVCAEHCNAALPGAESATHCYVLGDLFLKGTESLTQNNAKGNAYRLKGCKLHPNAGLDCGKILSEPDLP